MRTTCGPLALTGLSPAPVQVRGSFMLVPLLRDRPGADVRLHPWRVRAGVTAVARPDGSTYTGFVPHGLCLEWGAAIGAQVAGRQADQRRRGGPRAGRTPPAGRGPQVLPRMPRTAGTDRLHFLPRHLALEGLLALNFKAPAIAWPELSGDFVHGGVGCRWERVISGHDVPGYDLALRTFEIHQRQVGMLVVTSAGVQAAFVAPAPADYRLLHRGLLEDLYADLVVEHACTRQVEAVLGEEHMARARDAAGMRRALELMRRDWAEFTELSQLGDWQDRPLRTEEVYSPGSMRLERFVTDLRLDAVNHIGERLVRRDGELLYLSSMRLSGAQTRRAHLLAQLAAHEWNLPRAARAMGTDLHGLVARIEAKGFGHLICARVREQAAGARRRGEERAAAPAPHRTP